MLRKFLLFIFIICLCFLFWTKSSMSSDYYANKGKSAYKAGDYKEAISNLEKSLSSNPKNSNTRYFYVLALSKVEPTYSVQKKMFEIADSKIDDSAKKYAKSQIFSIKQKLLQGVENNYIYNAISGNEIIHWNIKSFPLKIYFESTQNIPQYYFENINKALSQWTNRTNFIKFSQASDKNDANIIINFKDYNTSDCTSAGCHYTVAFTTPEIGANGLLKNMMLTFYKTNPRKENFSSLEIYNAALHEIGHTLGIMGHSDNPEDVMYSNNDKTRDVHAAYRSESQYLSMNDIRTVALLYRLKPTITDVKTNNENFYYPPLILGSGDEVLQKKLVEWENYIQKYPNLSSGYVNLAAVYSDMGKYDSALRYLDLAQKLDSTSETMYTIEYNRAIIYYNMQDFKKALIYANKAKSIKPSPTLDEMIEEINKIK